MSTDNLTRPNLIRFYVPISMESLGKFDISGRAIIPMYINPESFQIGEKKIISKQLVKAGFSIQYWGEELPIITANGSTGSGGIEAARILRDVYRHEQIQFNRILLDRARQFAEEGNVSAQESTAPANTFLSFVDEAVGGALSQVIDGTESVIEAITNAVTGNINTEVAEAVLLSPTPAAYATSIDMVFGTERYRGFFETFNMTETAQSPGIVTYNFTFVVTKRWGKRTNYMPWHRDPFDSSGNPTSASLPLEGAREDELTFKTTNTTQQSITDPNLSGPNASSNRFVSDVTIPEENAVPINRREAIKK